MTAHVQTDVPIAGSEPSGATVLNIILNHLSSSGHNMVSVTNALYNTCRLTNALVREEVDPFGSDVPSIAQEPLNLLGANVASGDATPDGLCPFIFFKTDAATRSGRGGTHILGPFNANILDSVGRWDTAAGWWSSASALAAKFSDNMEDTFSTTGDVNWVIYSRTRRKRAQSPFVFGVTASGVRIQPRWLRRRMTSS